MDNEHGSIGTSIMIFLAGAAVGAAIVALTTPKTGPELRKDLRDMGDKLKERVARLRKGCCQEEEAPAAEDVKA